MSFNKQYESIASANENAVDVQSEDLIENAFLHNHDLKILKEVFNINSGNYKKINKFWKSYSIIQNISKMNNKEKQLLYENINNIHNEYNKLSKTYQTSRKYNKIPLN